MSRFFGMISAETDAPRDLAEPFTQVPERVAELMTSRERTLAARPVAVTILGLALALVSTPPPATAQDASAQTSSQTRALLEKAHVLEVRGRVDIATQTWQQVLLADPKNAEALGGLARAAKISGNSALAKTYLDRLRSVSPNDPGIARAENEASQRSQNALLQQAAKSAQAGQYAQAMETYRKVFGAKPPAGDWALAYYETESATEDGRSHAIEGLRELAGAHPESPRYGIALGRILTYSPNSRSEGRRLLEKFPNDPKAVEALRKALTWDAASPGTAPEIKTFLTKHADPELSQALAKQPPVTARPADAKAPLTGAEKAQLSEIELAYRALNAKRLPEAEQRFRAILATNPENSRALAGMGYIRMGQSNFDGALSFLEQVKQRGYHEAGLDAALATSRFWSTIGQASTALTNNDLSKAEQQFQAALALRPNSPEALEGLGGTLLKAQQFDPAAQVYGRLAEAKPSTVAPWRGLMLAQFGAGRPTEALETEARIPAAARKDLLRDPDYLRTLASSLSAVGRDADAQRVLRSAIELPFPTDAKGVKVETQLQYASLLQQANRLEQASGLFRQILAADPNSTPAWQGLIRIQHEMKDDAHALQTLQTMPPDLYETAMRDGGFQATVASVYGGANHPELAQAILEKAIADHAAVNQKPPLTLQLQLAGTYSARNNLAGALTIYRHILAESPDRADAWKGLLSALHSSGRDAEALSQAGQIPVPTRHGLENDVEYLQTLGNIYNGLGQPRQAMAYVTRVQRHFAQQHTAAPVDVDIQDAWLLFNGSNDVGLFRQLMLLGGRADMSNDQRRSVQAIWTSWAVRRANQAAAANDQKRSLAILNAAAKSFPDNPAVLRALAAGYARAGLPKQAVSIFKSQDMTSATASDYRSAVGAAIAAADLKTSETWLRFGLDAYPRDAALLSLGAKFEQARGNSSRAADYFRASLAALPPADPGAELASQLSQPAPSLPGSSGPQDLATLLGSSIDDPETRSEPSRPYLPNYENLNSPPIPSASSGTAAAAPYGAGSTIVPAYMANPSAPSSPAPQNTLGGYAPSTPAQSTVASENAFTPDLAPDLPPLSPTQPRQWTPAAPLTLPATTQSSRSTEPTVASRPSVQQIPIQPVPEPQPLRSPAPIPAPFFTPYIPPTINTGYTPSAVPVDLGVDRPSVALRQSEVTDVLPTARYISNAGAPSQPSRPGPLAYVDPSRPPSAQSSSSQPAPQTVPQPFSDRTPPSDADLVAKNVPPLREAYAPTAGSPGPPLTQREQTERELAALEGSYSSWIGGAASGRYRSGTPGFDRLADIESPVEASGVIGKSVRATIVPRAIFLSSGVVDTATFQSSTGTIPVLGHLPGNALVAPAQQFAGGLGGELQLTGSNIGVAVGYTPYTFLVSNVTGRFRWRPARGHFTLFADRDTVKDTQLSYAGIRDPASITGLYSGDIWGGVVSTTGGARLDIGNESPASISPQTAEPSPATRSSITASSKAAWEPTSSSPDGPTSAALT